MRALFRSAIAAVVLAGLAGITQPVAAQGPSVDVRIGHYRHQYRQHYRHGYRARMRQHRQYARYYREYARYYRAPVAVYRQREHKKRYLRWY